MVLAQDSVETGGGMMKLRIKNREGQRLLRPSESL